MESVWLRDYKEMFVEAWANENLTFGQTTTNRVESQHALIKRYIKGPNSSLHALVMQIDKVMESRRVAIKHSFEQSRSTRMWKHDLPLFQDVIGRVSHLALNLMLGGVNKINYYMEQKRSCEHRLKKTYGLPCSCQLQLYDTKGNIIF
jgi:histone-lysine N-methyltransferase SETD2